ncbi:glutathione hydrolase 5 proenzyme [Megalops cyprinoides]|uniref:glutathione hydrolase 5 proenzyme n=1 Tax=Megalops cyprinoides TaxID=118141 RepID=UPI001864B634|nr:glutathione hydrolase 5 proenzyme [Megalops cyprinoides]
MAKSKSRFCCFLCLALLCVISIVVVCIAVFANRRCPEGEFKRAAVAADSQTCSEIGRDMLLQGGSAADAAIAALLCTSLVNPQSMGLGGGAIFTILEKSGQAKVINARETVPKMHRPNLLKDCPETFKPIIGSQWIGIPGEIRAYELVHSRYGRLPWAKLFEPSIRLAREGFPCPPALSRYLQHHLFKPLVEGSRLCEVFCNGNKTALKLGEILKYPQLAETMETIAKEGADAFYKGKIARNLIQDVQAAGGTLVMEDLESFQAKVTDAWTVPLGDYMMYIPPPPAGGAILGFILNVMKGFNLTPSSIEDDKKVLTFHRYVEASKFANGQKHNIRDPSFNPGKDASWLIKDAFADHIRKMISSDATHELPYYNVTPSPDHFGTTHVSVLAEDGTAVSVTSTINHIFGSTVYSPKTGIILNNELADFCGKALTISAGEQPPSSMAPAVLLSPSRKKTLVVGGSGGSLITTAMALSIINHLWLGKALNESIAAPVVFVDSKNTLQFESGFDESVKEKLKQMGHSVENLKFPLNVVNSVSKEGHCISAVSDKRKLGKAAGY